MTYRNAFRDLKILCQKVGVTKATFHKFRHTFATEYLRNGGGELYLQRCLGHTSLQMTKRYAQISPEDLRSRHLKTSLLERVKR
jgi:integrase